MHINVAEINEARASDTIQALITDSGDGTIEYDLKGIVFNVKGPMDGRVDLTASDIALLLSRATLRKTRPGPQAPSYNSLFLQAFGQWLRDRPAKTMKIIKVTSEMVPELQAGKTVEIEEANYMVELKFGGEHMNAAIKTKYLSVNIEDMLIGPQYHDLGILMYLFSAHRPGPISLRLPFLMTQAITRINGEFDPDTGIRPLMAAIENGVPIQAAIALGDETNHA